MRTHLESSSSAPFGPSAHDIETLVRQAMLFAVRRMEMYGMTDFQLAEAYVIAGWESLIERHGGPPTLDPLCVEIDRFIELAAEWTGKT